jgi:hypothetical protein
VLTWATTALAFAQRHVVASGRCQFFEEFSMTESEKKSTGDELSDQELDMTAGGTVVPPEGRVPQPQVPDPAGTVNNTKTATKAANSVDGFVRS